MPALHGFPRSDRITRRQDYLRVYQHGEKQVGARFICYTLHCPGQGRKIGFAVSKKVGGAVVRNRMKRRLREIYRQARLGMADDVHAVVVARPSSAGLDYQQCEKAVRQLFRAGGLLRG